MNKALKKILLTIVISFGVLCLITSTIFFEKKSQQQLCSQLIIEGEDSISRRFLQSEDFYKKIEQKDLNPEGKPQKEIDTELIESVIQEHPFVRKAKGFITSNNDVVIKVKTRQPILRILTTKGDDYYLDRDTVKISPVRSFVAYLPLATGAITDSLARHELFPLALYLHNDPFWNAQIEQIFVQDNHEIVLIPRVGNQKIILGTVNHYREKLQKLYAFYQKGQNKQIGWNHYSIINLKYNNQVVCSK